MAHIGDKYNVQEFFDYFWTISDIVYKNLEIISDQVREVGGKGRRSTSRFEVIYYLYVHKHVGPYNPIIVTRLRKVLGISANVERNITEELSAKHKITSYKENRRRYVYLNNNRGMFDVLKTLESTLSKSEIYCLLWIAKTQTGVTLLFLLSRLREDEYIPISSLYKFISVRDERGSILRVLSVLRRKNMVHVRTKNKTDFYAVKFSQGYTYPEKLYQALIQAFGDPCQETLLSRKI